jgi:hypothetical protein
LLRGAARVFGGSILLVGAVLVGRKRTRLVGHLYTIARGGGMIAFSLKHRVNEYAVIHGR